MWNQLRKIADKKPWEFTYEEMIGKNPPVDEWARNWNEDEFWYSKPSQEDTTVSEIIHESPEWHNLYNIGLAKYQYAVAKDKEYSRWLLLVRTIKKDGEIVDDWSPVGEYRSGDMGIALTYRGEGAGTAFVKKLMELGAWHPSIGYSPEGLKSAQKAYKKIVDEAIERKERIPESVRQWHSDESYKEYGI